MDTIGGNRGRRIQVRAARKTDWSKADRKTFLQVLATTCNTSAAARVIGRAEWSARELRKRDGEFSRLWEEALAIGYERLEQQLLARALGQAPCGDNPTLEEIVDAVPPPLAAFDPALAISVLKMHSGSVGKAGPGVQPKRKSQAEIDGLLMARLDALATRRAPPPKGRRAGGEG